MLQPLTACHRGSGLSFARLMNLMLIPVLTQVLTPVLHHLKWCPESSDHRQRGFRSFRNVQEGVEEGLFQSTKNLRVDTKRLRNATSVVTMGCAHPPPQYHTCWSSVSTQYPHIPVTQYRSVCLHSTSTER